MDNIFKSIGSIVWTKKKIAPVFLILIMLDIIRLLFTFFQTEYQLTSPLIPANTILEVVRPQIMKALFSAICCLAAFIFYLYSRFTVCIVICAIGLAMPIVVFYFVYHPG